MDSSGEQLGTAEDEAVCTSASEGLEEGEVEGETLLIVESEDQGSVDLSHDQSGDSLTSDVGDEAEGGWACEDMSYYCDRCHKWIPAGEQPITAQRSDRLKSISCCSPAPERPPQLPERRQLLQVCVLRLLRQREGEL